ncbi:paired amphipathic helix protein Sin3-like 3 isoform X2 [Salvia miltiorrhiza]|uniref:paired amphipathic helix protein Sin3-like 3 isoform X2 n=1 Tax=Salvia miltiorrhiza TaxID=226208 RepID=UPI0025ACEBB0|nr:paired amphipathic helix protein Sin3-like 3 isoform X2 [Salvia miltiorrhiza]
MKRSRDDVFVTSQIKRPAVSPRVEQSGQVQLSTASSAQRLTMTDALSYLKNMKEMFQDRMDKYGDFLDVMKDFKAQRIDTSGVILRVKELFKGNRDLILGFNTFLPKGHEITLPLEDEPLLKKKPVEFDEAISFVTRIKTRFKGDDHVYRTFLDILNMCRKDNKSLTEVYKEVSLLFQGHPDLLVDFTHFLPDTSSAPSVHYAHSGRNHILLGDDRGSPMTLTRPTHVEKFEKDKEKGEDGQKNEWEHDENLSHRRKSSLRDDCAINQFHRGMPEMESDFRDKVKDRLRDPDIDEKFSDCIRSFKSKIATAAQFRILVSSLLGTHKDVTEACEDFVTYVERNASGSLRNNKQVVISLNHERDGGDHDWEDREKRKDYDIRERDRRDRGLASNTKDVIGQKIPSYTSKEKFMSKPIQDLDLSNCESCTPSYKLLPENFPIPSASCRTEIGAKVLNDRWVSVTSGSEDYSFKHMRKNQYEESLSRCEDDRFELDMLLESVNSTANRVEELLDSMNAHTNKMESSVCIEDHLSAIHLRCIERLYGDHGLDVMDVLRKNAPVALPVILTRLKQKQEEWARCRDDFNKVWAEICSKNYHKSLDYRSFYFKQQDTKNLSAKALLADIKEMSEKNQNEDEMVLSIAAGFTQPTKPHMEFEYPDLDIQDDIYKLMKYSCEEVCTPEQRDKIMKIWTTFLEPLLYVPSCPPSAEDEKHVFKANNHTKQNLNQIGRENSSHAHEVAYCERAEMSKGGYEIQPENSFGSGARIARGNNGDISDDSPGSYNVASKSDILCNASPVAPGENNMNEENDSATLKEDGHANADCGVAVSPSQEIQDDAITKLISCSTEMELEEVKFQKHHEQNESRSKGEREEGELSPNRILEENAVAAYTNTKVEQTLPKSDPSAREMGGGEEMCVEEAGEETDTNADNEGEESARVSSKSENASENGDDSRSESANGEECSPEEPDVDDADHDESDKKDESEGEEADRMADVDDTEGVIPISDRLLQTIKPLTINIPSALKCKEKNSRIFYGNDSLYLLFRLHQMLYERMQTAKLHSSSPENKWRASNDVNSADSYARFKDALHSLLNGSSDNAKFEDECRALVGSQSYILSTLDKLIHKLVKQLQFIATEEIENKFLQLYSYEKSRSPESFSDAVYYKNARFLLMDDNLYRMEFLPGSMRLTIQLMKDELDKLDPAAVSMDPYFASYLHDELLAVPEINEKPGVFLKRNKKLYSSGDEYSDMCKATEGLVFHNGVEMKVNCNSLKVSYVLGTEDFLYRPRRRRKVLYDHERLPSRGQTLQVDA